MPEPSAETAIEAKSSRAISSGKFIVSGAAISAKSAASGSTTAT